LNPRERLDQECLVIRLTAGSLMKLPRTAEIEQQDMQVAAVEAPMRS
jgi:hypothetical protein